jgi:hypothetical protein
MRAIAMHLDPGVRIRLAPRIATHMGAAVNDDHAQASGGGTFGNGGPVKASAYDKEITGK